MRRPKTVWWDNLAAGAIAGNPGGLARCPRLASFLGLELLAVADAMATGDYYRDGSELAAETIEHGSPAFWD